MNHHHQLNLVEQRAHNHKASMTPPNNQKANDRKHEDDESTFASATASLVPFGTYQCRERPGTWTSQIGKLSSNSTHKTSTPPVLTLTFTSKSVAAAPMNKKTNKKSAAVTTIRQQQEEEKEESYYGHNDHQQLQQIRRQGDTPQKSKKTKKKKNKIDVVIEEEPEMEIDYSCSPLRLRPVAAIRKEQQEKQQHQDLPSPASPTSVVRNDNVLGTNTSSKASGSRGFLVSHRKEQVGGTLEDQGIQALHSKPKQPVDNVHRNHHHKEPDKSQPQATGRTSPVGHGLRRRRPKPAARKPVKKRCSSIITDQVDQILGEVHHVGRQERRLQKILSTASITKSSSIASSISAKQKMPKKKTQKKAKTKKMGTASVAPFIDPLTGKLPLDPVTASDGRVYERQSLKDYFRSVSSPSSAPKSPAMGHALDPKVVLPAPHIRQFLETAILHDQSLTGPLADEWKEAVQNQENFQALLRQAQQSDEDGESMYLVGNIYGHGKYGIPKDSSKAMYWYSKASQAGNPKGMAMYGQHLIFHATNNKAQRIHGISLLSLAAGRGSDVAAFCLAHFYRHGNLSLLPQDLVLARHLLELGLGHDRNSVQYQHSTPWLREQAHEDLQSLCQELQEKATKKEESCPTFLAKNTELVPPLVEDEEKRQDEVIKGTQATAIVTEKNRLLYRRKNPFKEELCPKKEEELCPTFLAKNTELVPPLVEYEDERQVETIKGTETMVIVTEENSMLYMRKNPFKEGIEDEVNHHHNGGDNYLPPLLEKEANEEEPQNEVRV